MGSPPCVSLELECSSSCPVRSRLSTLIRLPANNFLRVYRDGALYAPQEPPDGSETAGIESRVSSADFSLSNRRSRVSNIRPIRETFTAWPICTDDGRRREIDY